jgi:rhodanese-related sulfurtransferase
MKILLALLIVTFLGSAPHGIAAEPKQIPAAKAVATKDVTPDEAAALMKVKSGAPIVIDVRTPDEFAEGHIPGAKNADFLGDDFERQIAELPADRPVIVHCASGNRSARAVAKMEGLRKFPQIFHLKSGFNGWKAAGKPVVTGPAEK